VASVKQESLANAR